MGWSTFPGSGACLHSDSSECGSSLARKVGVPCAGNLVGFVGGRAAEELGQLSASYHLCCLCTWLHSVAVPGCCLNHSTHPSFLRLPRCHTSCSDLSGVFPTHDPTLILPLQYYRKGALPFFWTLSLLPGGHFSNLPFLLLFFVSIPSILLHLDSSMKTCPLVVYRLPAYLHRWGTCYKQFDLLIWQITLVGTPCDRASGGTWGKVAVCVQPKLAGQWGFRDVGEQE